MENDLKICPYCGKEIKAVAKKCKYCGEWLDNQPSNAKPYNSQSHENVEGDFTGKKLVWIVGAVIVIAIIMFVIMMSNQKSDYEKALDEYNSNYIPTEEVTVDEVEAVAPDYNGDNVCPYDGIPDDDPDWISQDDPYSRPDHSAQEDIYQRNGNANSWE